MTIKRKYTTITIPAPLFEKVKEEIKDTGFSSVSDYATFVLRETVAKMRDKSNKGRDKDVVMAKLKALGYM
jgi:Arc/MetJ-type ribon-helix-helix transcriptional regulator